jgi:hypothetical protein
MSRNNKNLRKLFKDTDHIIHRYQFRLGAPIELFKKMLDKNSYKI